MYQHMQRQREAKRFQSPRKRIQSAIGRQKRTMESFPKLPSPVGCKFYYSLSTKNYFEMALTKKGMKPLALSSSMADFRVSPRRLNSSSVGRRRTRTPAKIPALSTEEWD